jgi:hypothetical protein
VAGSTTMGSVSTMTDLFAPMPLPAGHFDLWTQYAISARATELMLNTHVDPRPDSQLEQADRRYQWEKVSAWTRGYLRAAAQQLSTWADIVMPYDVQPGAVNHVAYVAYLMLARSALEAAAQGFWILRADAIDECTSRHVRMMRRDFCYHFNALDAGGGDTSTAAKRIADLERRAADLTPTVDPKVKPPGYEKLVRYAARRTDNDESEWAYFWHAASGAAHGQNWFSIEGFEVLVGDEYDEGHFRTASMPDPEFITGTIGAAVEALNHAAWRWMLMAGYNPMQATTEALLAIGERLPKIPDSD